MKARWVFFGRSRSSGRSGGSGAFLTIWTAGDSNAGLSGAAVWGAKARGADAKEVEVEATEEAVEIGAGVEREASWYCGAS